MRREFRVRPLPVVREFVIGRMRGCESLAHAHRERLRPTIARLVQAGTPWLRGSVNSQCLGELLHSMNSVFSIDDQQRRLTLRPFPSVFQQLRYRLRVRKPLFGEDIFVTLDDFTRYHDASVTLWTELAAVFRTLTW